MSDKIIILPDREEMLRRLVAVNDSSHYQERFYPILLKQAGQERVAEGIVLMLSLAVHEYTAGMHHQMANLLFMEVPDFIDALIDDKEAAEKTKVMWEEVLQD